MKKLILLFSCLLLFVVKSYSQATDKINFEMIVRDASGELLSNSTIGLKFQVLKSTNTGTIVFEETHSAVTNTLGVASVKIGGGLVTIGNLNAINWSNDPYFISIGIDPLGGSNYTLQSTSKLNSVPLATSTLKTAMALTADYNSLTNTPITITSNQATILGFLTVSNAINLNATKLVVDANTLKSFPGFGTTSGTAFEILWSKIGTDAFYENGNIGIGTNSNLNTSAAVLSVEGGILYETTTAFETEIGGLKYFNNGTPSLNDFYYGNNLGATVLFKSDPDKDIVFITDVNIISKLGIGESIRPSQDFSNNTFVIASPTPSIRFEDSSNSSSFPTADWSIEINDDTDFGDSYFSISNFNTGDSNFKIMAGAPSNAFNILENGNVGINIETPTTKMEVSNTVKALSFVGDSSGLTNIPSGTSNTSNTGSTTIAADNDSDTVGAIIFQTENQNKMTIESNGNVAIGNITPEVTLEVDGNLRVNDITAQNLLLNGHLKKTISLEILSLNTVDITDKSVIIMNPSQNVNIFLLTGGVEGQEVTFINSGTNSITLIGTVLQQNESITLVKNGNNFLVVNLVN